MPTPRIDHTCPQVKPPNEPTTIAIDIGPLLNPRILHSMTLAVQVECTLAQLVADRPGVDAALAAVGTLAKMREHLFSIDPPARAEWLQGRARIGGAA